MTLYVPTCAFTGSSRQFAGFSTEVDDSIINRIWLRAGEFFPSLKGLSLTEFTESTKVRIGLRPYSKYQVPYLHAK